jgi:Concanavalin A-like lectin/glucanases superfamily
MVRITATTDATVTSAPVAANVWHHVLVSRSGGTLRLWVDGARTEAASIAMPALDAITLGGGTYGGALDEVYVSTTGIADDETALGRWCPL